MTTCYELLHSVHQGIDEVINAHDEGLEEQLDDDEIEKLKASAKMLEEVLK